jgi:hypothetical protein
VKLCTPEGKAFLAPLVAVVELRVTLVQNPVISFYLSEYITSLPFVNGFVASQSFYLPECITSPPFVNGFVEGKAFLAPLVAVVELRVTLVQNPVISHERVASSLLVYIF